MRGAILPLSPTLPGRAKANIYLRYSSKSWHEFLRTSYKDDRFVSDAAICVTDCLDWSEDTRAGHRQAGGGGGWLDCVYPPLDVLWL